MDSIVTRGPVVTIMPVLSFSFLCVADPSVGEDSGVKAIPVLLQCLHDLLQVRWSSVQLSQR